MADALLLLSENYSSTSTSEDEVDEIPEKQTCKRRNEAVNDSGNKRSKQLITSKESEQKEDVSLTYPEEIDTWSNSSSETTEEFENGNKTIPLQSTLPVPSQIKDMFMDNFSDNVRQDDPSLHEGRIRTFPHEVGNWATYVYIPVDPNPELMNLAESLVNECMAADLSMSLIDHFHISVSRTIVLRHHWISSLVASLQCRIHGLPHFIASLQALEIYTNEEKTRTFLGIQVQGGYDQMKKIIHLVDRSLDEFKLPSFHKPPSLHMSIGWCSGDVSFQLNNLITKLQATCESVMGERDCRRISVKGLEMKTGCKVFKLPF